MRWNPSNVGSGSRQGVEIFRPQQNTLAIGETIRWTRNNRQLGLANGQSLTVEAIDGQRVTVRSSDGKALTVDTGKLEGRHWEHAYASTVYSSQGGTVKHALVNAEAVQRGLFSQKAFLVAISRHKESIRLFTDNTAAVAENVARHSGEKTSVTGSLREAAAYQFGDRWKATIAAIDEVMRGKPPRGRERLRELDHSSGGGKHRDRDFDR